MIKEKVSGKDKDKDKEDEIPSGPYHIPGTDLKTRTYYRISMKRYTSGYVTWVSKKDSDRDYRYVVIDDNKDNAKDYRKKGDRFRDVQWEFVPVSKNKTSRYYKLRNRGRPDEYASFSRKDYINEDKKNSYLVVDSKPEKRDRDDLLFKLVRGRKEKAEEGEDRASKRDYYQLKMKGTQNALVTLSDKEQGTDTFFLQVVSNKNQEYRQKYNKAKYMADTLFSFEPIDD